MTGTAPERFTIAWAYLLGFTGSEIAEGIKRSDDLVWRVLREDKINRRSRRKGRATPEERAVNVATVRDMLAAQRRIA